VFDFERNDGQDFVIDAELEVDIRPAAHSDNLDDTVDYGVLATRLAVIVGRPPLNLIETLVERLAHACLQDPRVQAATVTVHKPAAPVPVVFSDVMVTVRRTRADLPGGAS